LYGPWCINTNAENKRRYKLSIVYKKYETAAVSDCAVPFTLDVLKNTGQKTN